MAKIRSKSKLQSRTEASRKAWKTRKRMAMMRKLPLPNFGQRSPVVREKPPGEG